MNPLWRTNSARETAHITVGSHLTPCQAARRPVLGSLAAMISSYRFFPYPQWSSEGASTKKIQLKRTAPYLFILAIMEACRSSSTGRQEYFQPAGASRDLLPRVFGSPAFGERYPYRIGVDGAGGHGSVVTPVWRGTSRRACWIKDAETMSRGYSIHEKAAGLGIV